MKKVILASLMLAPAFAFAAADLTNIKDLVGKLGELIDIALPVVIAIALLAFLWGVVKFVFAQGNEEAKADAKKIMVWGLIGLAVMVSVWGIVKFIQSAFGFTGDEAIKVPILPSR